MEEAPFIIDRAKTGRASCRGCRQPCAAGELRMAKMGIGPFGEGRPMPFWYHLDCLMAVFLKQRPTTKRVESISDIGNFLSLSPEDRAYILKKLNDTEIEYAKKHNSDPKYVDESVKDKEDKASANKNDEVPKKYDVSHRDNKFEDFCNLCMSISENDKYTAKTAIVNEFLTKGTDKTDFKGDVALWCRLLLPGAIKRVYNLKRKQLVKLFSRIFKVNPNVMLTDLEKGNVGETIENFFQTSGHPYASHSTVTMFEVDDFLNELSGLTKEEEQIQHFKTIVNKCTPKELKYLIYLINGDLRMNAGPKHVLEAIHPDAYKVFETTRDINVVMSKVLESKNSPNLQIKSSVKAEVMLLTPIHPMLAEACKSVQMAMEKCKNGMLSEIKYDGERVQLHKSGTEFKYFSRSLKSVLGHKVSRFKDFIPRAFPHGNDLILDSEILMIDTHTGKPLPFGSLGVHKQNEYKDAEVCLMIFDCLYFNGQSLLNEPMSKRRKILEENISEIKNHVMVSEVKIIREEEELIDMIIKVLKLGLEGLVLKDLQSKYEPGKRHWLKIKKDYLCDGAMADSADLVVLGAWFGTGKKGGMLSVFLMGCYNQVKAEWLTVTKVHTGHDDETLESLQEPLKNSMIKISQNSALVPKWLKCTKTMIPDFVAKDPKQQPVWEIRGTEFTQAQIHTADGISIRFPRVIKIRDDKCWQTATSFQELQKLFKNSKENTDLVLLEKLRNDKGVKQKINTNFTEIDSDLSAISPLKKGKKRKIEDEKQRIVKMKVDKKNITNISIERELKENDFGDNSNVNARKCFIKVPFPDVFTGHVIGFYPEKSENSFQSDINKLKRYVEAYGGMVVDFNNLNIATHVIHFKNEARMKDIYQRKLDFSKSARHVTVDWLKDSIRSIEIKNVILYPVFIES